MNGSSSYLNEAVSHYNSLFTVPSHTRIVVYLFLSGVIGGALTFVISQPSLTNLIQGAVFGFFTLALASLFSDIVAWLAVIKNDIILNLRRSSALSLVMCYIWVTTLIVGSAAGKTVNAFLLGFSVVLAVRFLVISSISSLTIKKGLLASFFQPVFCFLVASIFWDLISTRYIFAVTATSLILLASVSIFLKIIDRYGEKKIGLGALSLFKAFIADWMADVNRPLEELFDKLSYTDSVLITTLGFKGENRVKAIISVPALHPGPFKNVGSSVLAFQIQQILEREKHAIVCVPHGTSGHELDLVSQAENEKVLRKVLELSNFYNFTEKATRLIRVAVDSAKATSQIFGDCAFITLTCSPKVMEDIPREMGLKIVNKGKEAGLSAVAVVDAHNSIEGKELSLSNEDRENLQKAAEQALFLALKAPREKFEIGAAKVTPKDFTLAQGMGPGGIVTIVVKVGEQRTAYVVVDCNNLVSGLREKILNLLSELGMSDGEILTTDTHMVNGITLVKMGYHPLGEVISHQRILGYVKEATQLAMEDLQEAAVAWNTGEAHQVKAIGSKHLKELALLVDSTAKLTKRLALTIFPLGFTLSILLLAIV